MTTARELLQEARDWFCCRATWGGYHIWERGNNPRLIAWGACARTAWQNAMKAKP